jgi:putative transposase
MTSLELRLRRQSHERRSGDSDARLDEHTRECLAIDVAPSLKSEDVLERLSDLFVCRSVTTCIRSDNGSELTATKVREWLARGKVKTLFVEPGSPWENGYVESFNGKLRDELLAREQLDTLLEAKILIKRWRRRLNAVRYTARWAIGFRPQKRFNLLLLLRLRLGEASRFLAFQLDQDWGKGQTSSTLTY